MTLERAAELVAIMRRIDSNAAFDLFCHFDDVFQLNSADGIRITRFAELCGYGIATNVMVA